MIIIRSMPYVLTLTNLLAICYTSDFNILNLNRGENLSSTLAFISDLYKMKNVKFRPSSYLLDYFVIVQLVFCQSWLLCISYLILWEKVFY